jgi:hypothetical protein
MRSDCYNAIEEIKNALSVIRGSDTSVAFTVERWHHMLAKVTSIQGEWQHIIG